ncbi:molybdate ABC transporter substrate-binding protein [Rhizobiales bacterium TNE-4]|nr:molybdate ABC transporter substrate-binding protein [Rhizobiales bacterium TNE-4]MBV1828124.1 molybdate ABC transporter substrate-binding protein [Rhizobiales bacterium TNE-4]
MLARRAFIAAALSALSPPLRAAAPLTIFAAASLKTALDALAAPMRHALSAPVRLVYASSAVLARQIEQGAPADLFWSADREWMEWCSARHLVRKETIVDLLGNQLVLIAPATAPLATLALQPSALKDALGDGRLAIGETRSVPAGRYAKEALTTLGLWDGIATRLAETDNVRAALLLTARGETPLGIVYASDAMAEPRVKILATFPATSHKPIVYPLALTREASMPTATHALRFLQGPDARAIFMHDGFSVLTPQRPA